VAKTGTLTVIEVLVQNEALAATVPNCTTPEVPKPVPRIVTLLPTSPRVRDSELMTAVPVVGGGGEVVVVVVGGGVVVVVVVGGGVVVVVVGGGVVVVVVGGGAAATVIEYVVEAVTPERTHTV